MKRLTSIILIGLFAIILGACTKVTTQPVEGMINPGDKIGDFLITTGESGDVTFFWELDSTKGQEANTTFCEVAWGMKLIGTVGIYDDNVIGRLDEYWWKWRVGNWSAPC